MSPAARRGEVPERAGQGDVCLLGGGKKAERGEGRREKREGEGQGFLSRVANTWERGVGGVECRKGSDCSTEVLLPMQKK